MPMINGSFHNGSFHSQALAPVESSLLVSGSRARSSSGAPGDARRFVSMLRGEPEVGGTGTLAPFGAWEPGDRGSAPSAIGPWGPKSPLASARASPQIQLDALAERVGSVVAGLQRQCDVDKRTSDRRFQQLEKQLQVALGRLEGDHARDGDWREKFTLVQGSITGLVDESQALSRRLDSLDERLWSRTSSSEEIARQGSRELGLQLQAFERQARLSAAAVEEAQKRQTNRQRRAEGMLEDVVARVAQIEDRCGLTGDGQPTATEIRLQDLEAEVGARLQALEVCANNVQAQLDALHLANVEEAHFCATVDEERSDDGLGGTALKGDLRGAVAVVEDDMRALERRLSTQLEELSSSVASLRVKADGQMQRQSSLAERLETAHVPALEALRNDLLEVRSRDLSEMRGQVSELERKLDLNLEGLDVEPLIDKMERLSQRVSGGEAASSALRREVHELRRSGSKWNPPRGSGGFDAAGPTIQEQLGAVADQLEALDELANRVSLLDGRVCGLEKAQHGKALETVPAFPGLLSSDRAKPLLDSKKQGLSGETSYGKDVEPECLRVESGRYAREALRSSPSSSLSQRRGGSAPGLQATSLRAPPAQSTEVAASAISSAARPSASPTPSAPSLSRKQSLESTFSCEVAVEQDECVESSREDALRGRCDVTMEVISPSQALIGRDAITSAEKKMFGRSSLHYEEADDISAGSSCHKSFEDEDIASQGSDDF